MRLLFAVLIALHALPLFAFSGEEHIDISNTALAIAISAALKECPCADDCWLVNGDFERLLTREAIGQRISYGDLVAFADRASSVEAYFDTTRSTRGLPRSLDDVAWAHIRSVWANSMRNYQALHLNQAHFQHGALFNQRQWHEAAVRSAARGELGAAILYSAYSDHFLQDFFAPGHVMAVRVSSDDAVSLTVHDRYNEQGLYFAISPDAHPWIEDLARVAADVREIPAVVDEQHRSLPFVCLRELGTKPLRIELHGDGSLAREHVQAAFLTLVTARSILDVLLSYCQRKEINTFASYKWEWNPVAQQLADRIADLSGPLAANAVGEYLIPTQDVELLKDFGFRWPTLVAGTGLQFFPGNSESGRWYLDVDVLYRTLNLPETLRARGREVPTVMPIQSVAYFAVLNYTGDDDIRSIGAGTRISYPIPRIDVQVNVSPGVRYFHGVDSGFRPYLGIDTAMGFGILFFRVGAYYDYRAKHGSLAPGFAIRSGVSLVIPTSKLKRRAPRAARAVDRRFTSDSER